jgi:predicted TIM-barrel fold metal-dependent hydrolase
MAPHRLVGFSRNRPELHACAANGVMHELSRLSGAVLSITTPGGQRAVLDIVPMSHLPFGSDYPFWSPKPAIEGLANLKRAAAGLQATERGNALKLLPNVPR